MHVTMNPKLQMMIDLGMILKKDCGGMLDELMNENVVVLKKI